ncbi:MULTISPECIES: flagellar transcriptional regulator FlhD [unclassified Variovorax]|jgi:flagellar transcriptional activator FlhD|uniref:flagellar transcriptional regulator FlhD n=1 Tax=unclassified Variovorax TaxID=663243 RepID=UPI000D120F71|nr:MULTISPECIES: flagellar transcriptional regulator FlhD [unclassified Variovorax]AVQ81288.1 flagellar transcriptional activator FlhD [Variovorax sp. PMC12]QRY29304.1 flagellar transcriptional regulator FlhD [Variovorax sp. PDNC026]
MSLENLSGVDRQLQKEIGDFNLMYMLLAQKLVKQDEAVAMRRLGIGKDLAELLANMSSAQIAKLAETNLMLCSFRPDDAAIASKPYMASSKI